MDNKQQEDFKDIEITLDDESRIYADSHLQITEEVKVEQPQVVMASRQQSVPMQHNPYAPPPSSSQKAAPTTTYTQEQT